MFLKMHSDRSFCVPILLLQCKSSKLSVKINVMTGIKFSALMSENSYCDFLGCNTTQFASTDAPDECSVPVIGVMEAVPEYTVVQPRRPQYNSFFLNFCNLSSEMLRV